MKKALCYLVLLINLVGFSQKKYWIDFNIDFYSGIDSLKKKGFEIKTASEWLESVSIKLSEREKEAVQRLSYISDITPVQVFSVVSNNSFISADFYGDYLSQMKPEVFDSLQLDGEGIVVGVIDAGFTNADSSDLFAHIRNENRIVAFKDFITPDDQDFFHGKTDGDVHGHNVLGYLAGYDETENKKIGLATGALFYLARTENGDKEHLVEEDDWVKAIEWMYENGVQLVNTSLGYSEFDDPKENHEISDMNGRSTKISRAAEIAVMEKGMVIVVSAGNTGHKPWKHITAPADARGVITVGATNKNHMSRIFYSSTGVEFVSYIKPDVSSYSDRGTSYASPSVCGFVACIMQYAPELTNLELKDIIIKSSHLYPYGNNYVGYGVPQADRAIGLINGTYDPQEYTWMLTPKTKKTSFKLEDVSADYLVAFNKLNRYFVKNQNVINVKDGRGKKGKMKVRLKNGNAFIKLKRKKEISFTTIQIGKYVVEVSWQ